MRQQITGMALLNRKNRVRHKIFFTTQLKILQQFKNNYLSTI
jgi:hypothetical protein